MFLRRIRSLIGLDVGSRAVKAIELTWNGSSTSPPVITAFGYAELPSVEAVPETVLRVLRENNFHSRRVATSVSGKAVIVRTVTMGKMGVEDLRNAIRFEADKYIPFDVDEVVLDCQPGNGGGEIRPDEMYVLFVACKRAVIDEQIRVLALAGLHPEIIDVDVFALGNAFETAVRPGAEAGSRVSALVDVGASKTCVNLVQAGASLFTREIHTGGDAFTSAIAHRLSLEPAAAEALKRRPREDQERVRGAVTPAIEDLAQEIRLSFEYFVNQRELAIDEVLLSGGGSRLVGLDDDLSRILERPTTAWDPTGDMPFAAGSVDVDGLREHLPELAVAVGLASRVRR